MSHIYDLVMEELGKIPGGQRRAPNHTFILCPFHNEKSPSGRVLHYPDGLGAGSFKCYGCGYKCGWNELAKVLNLKQYGKKEARQDEQTVPPTNIENLEKQLLGNGKKREALRLFPLSNAKAVANSGLTDGKWRTFKLDFLDDVGVQLAYVQKIDETGNTLAFGRWYMYLPIEIRGKTVGYIKAQIHKPKNKEIPSYINSHGGWSLKQGLFPYDYAVWLMKKLGVKTIALVEGPRDALRLLRFGIPAISIMGTHSWGQNKIRQLELAGVERVVVMMDGDAAGRKATRLMLTGKGPNDETVCTPLSESFTVKVVRLWLAGDPSNDSKYDPGNCPVDILRTVKQKLVK